jgi:hypothetical protein
MNVLLMLVTIVNSTVWLALFSATSSQTILHTVRISQTLCKKIEFSLISTTMALSLKRSSTAKKVYRNKDSK